MVAKLTRRNNENAQAKNAQNANEADHHGSGRQSSCNLSSLFVEWMNEYNTKVNVSYTTVSITIWAFWKQKGAGIHV